MTFKEKLLATAKELREDLLKLDPESDVTKIDEIIEKLQQP